MKYFDIYKHMVIHRIDGSGNINDLSSCRIFLTQVVNTHIALKTHSIINIQMI